MTRVKDDTVAPVIDEFSWFVGFWDGEGCFYYHQKDDCLMMSLHMKDEWLTKRAASFMRAKPRQTKIGTWRVDKKLNLSPTVTLRPKGLWTLDLIRRMYPHLSPYRQETLRNIMDDLLVG